ncbi:hypothetical protein CRM94_25805 [Burkholderia gladioli]|nr:hypothetical protein CEJ98_13360 [Burkholderia gladioli pv. gladioli]AWY54873.1 hypothetical protein A8H28_27765 [Burkholderia gladioli pv. gladioli]PEH37883.1 hypothetical protein CRM94_25805 [Burkholderia gladioli]
MDHQARSWQTEITDAYEQELLGVYRGEVLGHRFFLEMAGHYRRDTYARRAFALLAVVEHETGLLLRGLLVRHRIECPLPIESSASGVAAAQAMTGLPWPLLMEAMAERICPAIVRFEALLGTAPAEDHELIELLVEHERALEAFVRCGRSRRNDALKASVRYLRRLKPTNSQRLLI